MNRVTIFISILFVAAIGIVSPLIAQEEAPATAQEEATTVEVTSADASQPFEPSDVNSHQIRSEFSNLLRNYPPELSSILKLDPTLLSNEGFLEGYPALQQFIDQNPEVRRNPRFYLEQFVVRGTDNSSAEMRLVSDIFEMIAISLTILVTGFVFLWLVKTTIEQRRWSRMSKLQNEVHNKLLDRFGSNDEVLRYMETKAGKRFLESAPIPVQAEDPSTTASAPVNRIIWSIQIGLVIAAGAVGFAIVSFTFEEAARSLFALGVIGICVGAGFIASGFASMALSKRLGIWKADEQAEQPSPSFVD